jgi:hypothetical protein
MDFIELYETKEISYNCFKWGGEEVLRGRDDGGDVTNVQYKSHQNCHCEFPPYNEYILIKNLFKKRKC